jgi:RNA polymerase sigma factor (sigma-70 family)
MDGADGTTILRTGVRSVAAWPATERIPASRSRPVSGGPDMPEADPDGGLVERARRGNEEAYGQLVARHQDVAFRVAYLITRDADDAADAAQVAFIKAYRGLASFRPGWPFRPWLLRIVGNEARNVRRAARTREGLAVLAGRTLAEVDPPDVQVLAMERRTALLDALDRGREDDRLVIAYRYFFELSEAEMAVALDCPPGTVKSRLSRAIERLRRQLGADASVNPRVDR